MEKEMPNLKLHETADVDGTNMQITRVHGGFIYSFWDDTNAGGQRDIYQHSYVFVPL